MQVLATHGERGRRLRLGLLSLGLLSLTASGLGQFAPARKSLAPSGHAMLQGRPRFDDLTPALAATIRTALSRQPSSAQRCNAQQDGLAMKNAFVQPPHQHPALASPLQDLPDATRLLSALLHPAPHRGPAGPQTAGPHDRQHDPSLWQAHPQGRARRRQRALLGLAEGFRLRPGLPKGLLVGRAPLMLSPQGFIADATGLVAGHRLHHALGVRGEGRAALATLLRAPSDRSPGATHPRRRMAHPLRNRSSQHRRASP